MVNDAMKTERPIPITLISVFLLFSTFTAFYYIFKGVVASSVVSTLLLAIGGTISLVCGIGFWLMKKWAVYLYAIYGVVNQIVLLLLGRWNFFPLLLLVIVIYFGYRNLSKMS